MELTLYNNHSENIKVDKTISKVGVINYVNKNKINS